MAAVVSSAHGTDARRVRAALALLAQTQDARALGLATDGDPALRSAVRAETALGAFLRQREPSAPQETVRSLRSLAALVEPQA
jgi:flagellar biosynthesis/type III secretory pathway ATPase